MRTTEEGRERERERGTERHSERGRQGGREGERERERKRERERWRQERKIIIQPCASAANAEHKRQLREHRSSPSPPSRSAEPFTCV